MEIEGISSSDAIDLSYYYIYDCLRRFSCSGAILLAVLRDCNCGKCNGLISHGAESVEYLITVPLVALSSLVFV